MLATYGSPLWAQESRLPEPSRLALPPVSADPLQAAKDSAYWQAVRELYNAPDDLIQLEHGNWGMMARPVEAVYHESVTAVNRYTSHYSRRQYGSDQRVIMEQLSLALGVDSAELAPVRNATEALTTLIGGYNRLSPGDAILYADLDYSSMQGAMDSLRERRGVSLVTIKLPEPATRDGLIGAYEAALRANPRVRLLLITHISHRTGLLLPVREIVDMARSHDVDVIVDSAHAWGQVDFQLADIGADFVGLNLHKWIGAPLGLGLMYVKKERLADIDIATAEGGGRREGGSIHARVHPGTMNIAAMLSVPTALQVHQQIGPKLKEERLRYLRDLWVERLRDHAGIEILTPQDRNLYAGITSFRLKGQTSVQENVALMRRLWDEHGIFTVQRDGVASGSCVRVTPAVFTGEREVTALAEALEQIVAA